jgi:hypothetical protein
MTLADSSNESELLAYLKLHLSTHTTSIILRLRRRARFPTDSKNHHALPLPMQASISNQPLSSEAIASPLEKSPYDQIYPGGSQYLVLDRRTAQSVV